MGAPGTELVAIEQFRNLPREWLAASAVVDFVLMFGCGKRAVRIRLADTAGIEHLSSWCDESHLDFASDSEGFCCVSTEPMAARRILELDRSTRPHEIDLGHALGYPSCCCDRIAMFGESRIDVYAQEVAQWSFIGCYRRISPCGYSSGTALISHLPCSPDCQESLVIANGARRFVMANASEPLLSTLANSALVRDEC